MERDELYRQVSRQQNTDANVLETSQQKNREYEAVLKEKDSIIRQRTDQLGRISYARKQKKMTQNDLGKAVGTSGDIIGKYERNEIKPSIDTAAKIAEGILLTTIIKNINKRSVTF